MTFLPELEELDRDGAIRETAEQVDGSTRAAFLRKAGVGAGTVLAGSAFAGALPAISSAAAIPASDIAILNFALTLEYLEADFYAQANENKFLKGEYIRFSSVVAQHEASHVAFLKKVLGTKAVAKPKFDFKDAVTDQDKFAATSQALEDTGVHAYLGQVPNIKAKAVLIGAGRILPVEARHASWIRDIRYGGGHTSQETPAPSGFEDGFSKAKILAAVKATGFIVG
jgi:Ferritin-like domain